MIWYYFIYVLILIGAILSLINSTSWRVTLQKLYIPAIFIVLFLFAALRSAWVDRDYSDYIEWFNYVVSASSLYLMDWIKDPAFVLLMYVASLFSTAYTLVLVMVGSISLYVQYVFAKVVRNNRWLLMLLYLIFCRFFIEQGMTQIRAGIAIPLMSLCILLAYDKKTKLAIMLYVCAACFHLSALVGLPVFLLIICGARFDSKAWIISLVPIGIIGSIALKPLWNILADFSRTSDYLNGDVEHLRLLSVYFVVHLIVLLFVFVMLWDRSSSTDRLIIFSSAIGLFFQVLLSSNSALALRVSEVFGFFDMALFIIPLSHLKRQPLAIYALFVIALGFVFFMSALKIIGPYQWILG